jgi:riboflavin kinase/FMN adenylyltransferase
VTAPQFAAGERASGQMPIVRDSGEPAPAEHRQAGDRRARVVHDLDELAGSGEYAVTIGRFDGVHLGHRHLLGLTAASARRHGLRSLAITFEPHPEQVLRPERPPARLTLPARKAALLAASGVDAVAIVAFTPEFSRQLPEEFVARLLDTVRPRELWVGEDFVFGYKRSGTPERLAQLGRQHGFAVHRVPRLHLPGGEMISATGIRDRLLQGDATLARRLLGRPYALEGIVVHGAHRGRALGYPTANLQLPPELVVPANGIYATLVDVPGVVADHPAMTSIGVRPVFDNGERLVEAHLLDWSGDLYGRPLALHFVDWLRPEANFPSVEALVEQMGRDGVETAERVRAYRDELAAAAPAGAVAGEGERGA